MRFPASKRLTTVRDGGSRKFARIQDQQLRRTARHCDRGRSIQETDCRTVLLPNKAAASGFPAADRGRACPRRERRFPLRDPGQQLVRSKYGYDHQTMKCALPTLGLFLDSAVITNPTVADGVSVAQITSSAITEASAFKDDAFQLLAMGEATVRPSLATFRLNAE